MNNDEMFKFINPNSNDTISSMKSKDLIKLMSLLQKYLITYRDSLNIDKDITFGVELEYENINGIKRYNAFSHMQSKENKTHKFLKTREELYDEELYDEWIVVEDASLRNGEEINSPILTDEKQHWEELKDICNMTQKYANIGPCSGGHIHIGSNIFKSSSKTLLNFLRVWSLYENIIYRFSYGEYLVARPLIDDYAMSCRKVFNTILNLIGKDSSISYIDTVLNVKQDSRYYGVNFNNIFNESKNTIEFRCPNGSLESIIWQNNINLFTKLLLFSRTKNFDEDIIIQREKLECSDEIYSEIYVEKAIELADLIFNNNLDKLNFLRQYLKSFDCSNKEMAKAKTFIKK